MTIFVKLAILLGLLLALVLGVRAIDQRGYDRASAEATAALAKQKQLATAELAAQTLKTRAAEEALRTFKLNQDAKDAQAQSTVADLSRRVRSLAGASGRLRDPNAQGCGGSSGGATGADPAAPRIGAKNPAEGGGLLSADLTGLLQRLTREADTINAAYASCRADAYSVRAQP